MQRFFSKSFKKEIFHAHFSISFLSFFLFSLTRSFLSHTPCLIFFLSAKQYEIKLFSFFLSRHKTCTFDSHSSFISCLSLSLSLKHTHPLTHTHTHLHSHVKCECDLFLLPHLECLSSLYTHFATTSLHTHTF